jgi:adenine-specific DNA-methyltransferase
MKASGRTRHQYLPASGESREMLREKGQFWTPAWVAEAMVHYVVADSARVIFDPAVGEGAFFRAAKAVAGQRGEPLALRGTEIDPVALAAARQNGLTSDDLAHVEMADFLGTITGGRMLLGNTSVAAGISEPALPAIVANPPYIRHHRVAKETKERLQAYGRMVTGSTLDGRAGYHIYFLLHALRRLEPGGRLAFIMPADTVEGVFSATLWQWITRRYRLDAVATFSPDATPFPGVDTNAVVLMLRNAAPSDEFWWARCRVPETDGLVTWVRSGFAETMDESLVIHRRTIAEGLATGLSRPPQGEIYCGPILADYAMVLRGIATGDNDFFFLTRAQTRHLGIPDTFLRRAIGRTRDLPGNVGTLTTELLDALDAAGRPTFLFSPDARPLGAFPPAVRAYLEEGAQRGVSARPLISQRNPWYKMEVREPPSFLFAYLGRRNSRFIRNRAGAVPLTVFLCVYAREGVDPDKLWSVLDRPQTVANLARVGKSYGDGAIKVEPRALERLPLPEDAVAAAGLTVVPSFGQMPLLSLR